MRVLLVKMSSLGDVVHTLPALTDAVANVPGLSLIHISEPTRPFTLSRMPSSA